MLLDYCIGTFRNLCIEGGDSEEKNDFASHCDDCFVNIK